MAGKTRSRNYPAFGLGEAIARARRLYEQDGKAAVPTDVAVRAWGYGTLNGASLRTLGAVRQYGLLDDAGDKLVKLSSRALTILLEPEDSPERVKAIQEAANSPAVFRELIERYGDGLPSDAGLISYLVRHENFTEDAARSLIAAFRDTLGLVSGLPATNITNSGNLDEDAPDPNAALRRSQLGLTDVLDRAGVTKRSPAPEPGGAMQFQWPLSGDAVATLTVTRELDPDDVETLADYLEIAKRTLAKAARARAASAPPTTASEE